MIDVLRGSEVAAGWLRSLDAVPSCSELSRAEVLLAVRSAERTRAERLLSVLEWVPVDEVVSRHAGELGSRYRASHPGVGITDLVIAATAELTGADLATANVRHYPMFADLQPPYTV